MLRGGEFGYYLERKPGTLAILAVNCTAALESAQPPWWEPVENAPRSSATRAPRILIVARPDRKRYPIGGVETLTNRVIELMRERGAHVEVQETAVPDARDFDVAHICGGLGDHIVAQGQAVKSAGKPLAITPIFATMAGFVWFTQGTMWAYSDPRAEIQAERLQQLAARSLSINNLLPQPAATEWRSLPPWREGLLLADDLFVCAWGEAREIFGILGVLRPCTLIPNGVETSVMRPDAPLTPIVPTKRPYVLMATRFDVQKNIQRVVRAVRGLDVDLVLIGRLDDDYAGLAQLWASLANNNVTYIPHLPTQSHPWFASLFAHAAAVVVPSWSECFSLTALDAAACATPVVIGWGGFVTEELGDVGYYIDPADENTIRDAIVRAIEERGQSQTRRIELARRIHEKYNWERVGDLMYDAYKRLAGI